MVASTLAKASTLATTINQVKGRDGIENEHNEMQSGAAPPPETKEAFDKFCEAHDCTQNDAVELLLDLQRLQKAAEANPKRAEILNSFRAHVAALIALQEASLVLADDMKTRAREEFAVQSEQNDLLINVQKESLSAKEVSIAELQHQLLVRTIYHIF